MTMVWPLPADNVDHSQTLTTTDPHASHASLPTAGLPAAGVVFKRVAVMVSANVSHPGARDIDGTTLALADLAESGLIDIDLIPACFTGADAATNVGTAFAQVAIRHRQAPYDALLILGCGDVEPDVGLLHTVLAPGIADAGMPVLTAIGSDDANTILGDVAKQVFPNPPALLDFVAARLIHVPIPAAEVIVRIGSLASFLLTELAVESRILLDAAVRPALQKHLAAQFGTMERWRQRMAGATVNLAQRVVLELATLEKLKALIDGQLVHRTTQRRLRSRRALARLRLLSALAYGAFVALLWVTASTAQVVFFSGCALVLLSAVYTALSDRIQGDIEAISVNTDGARARAHDHGAAPRSAIRHATPPPFSRHPPGAFMNDQPNEHVSRAYRDAADENLLLGAILQRLEQSDHLSLDELDAIILQADAAYKGRLARLERTRTLIASLGTSGEPA